MKQKTKNTQPGFILIWVIAALTLVASTLLILTSVSNRMADHTRRMYQSACERNEAAGSRARVNMNNLEQKLPAPQPTPQTGSLQFNEKNIPAKTLASDWPSR